MIRKHLYHRAAGVPPGTPLQQSGTAPPNYTVTLVDPGPRRLNVIIAVRQVTELGILQARRLVESAPVPVRIGLKRDEAEQIRHRLCLEDATVDVRPDRMERDRRERGVPPVADSMDGKREWLGRAVDGARDAWRSH